MINHSNYKRSVSLAITFAIAGAYMTCITPSINANAQENKQENSIVKQQSLLTSTKDTKPNPKGDTTKVVTSNNKSNIVENTKTYNKLVDKIEAEEYAADTEGISTSIKKLRDGTGHDGTSKSFINSDNGFDPGDNTPTDGYVTAGDTVTYEFGLNFAPGKKRHIDIIWSDVVDENGRTQVASNLCDSSEAGITAIGNSQGYCRYIIEEGATGSITRQISYKAPNSTDGSTKFKWAPQIYTSQGPLEIPEVTVLSAPSFDMYLSSNKAKFGKENILTVGSKSYYKDNSEYSYSKGNHKGDVEPFKVAVDVSNFPDGTIFTQHDVKDGKITLEFDNTSQDIKIPYVLPEAPENDQGYKEEWETSIEVLDPMKTLDGTLNLGDGNDPYLKNNTLNIESFVSEKQPVGDILQKKIATPDIKDNKTIYSKESKKFNPEKYDYNRNIAADTEVESQLNINAKNTNHSAPKMHLIDVWDTDDVHFDDTREVRVLSSGLEEGKTLDYDIYYSTKNFFSNGKETPSMPEWNDSSWTKQKPSDPTTITGVKLVINNNNEITRGSIDLRIPQITLHEQDYNLDNNLDGDSTPIPDWYQSYFTAKNDTLGSSSVYSKNVNVIGSVYPKPIITREVNTKDNEKTLGDEVKHTIKPYIYDVMSSEDQLRPEIVEYLDKCLAEINFSDKTKEYYDISIEGTPGDNCRVENGKPTKVTLTPKKNAFNIGKLPYNIEQKIKKDGLTLSKLDNSAVLQPIEYTGKLSYDTPAYQETGYSYDNNAVLTLPESLDENNTSAAEVHTSILQKTDVSAVKTTDKNRIGLDDEITWNLKMSNFSGRTGKAEFIDVLPWNGSQAQTADGDKTNFSGDLKFVSADLVEAPEDAKILYTNAKPEDIDPSQKEQSGITWYDSPEKAGGADKVTAIKIVIPDFGGKGSSHLDVKIKTLASDAKNGDVYVNQMSAVDMDNGLDVPAPGAVSVKSVSSNISGNIWWDKNHNYTNDSEDGISGVKVYARRTGDSKILETTTDDTGSYKFSDVRSGQYDIWFDRGDDKGKVPDTGTTTYDKTEEVKQTFSYGGNTDNNAQNKVSAFVMSAQDLEDVDFGFLVPDPLLKVDKKIVSQEDNGDGTVTVKYDVSATNNGTGTMGNVSIMDSADKKQNMTAESAIVKGGGDYKQVEQYVMDKVSGTTYNVSLAVNDEGELYIGFESNSYGHIPYTKIHIEGDHKVVRLHESMPMVELDDGTILWMTQYFGNSSIGDNSPLNIDRTEEINFDRNNPYYYNTQWYEISASDNSSLNLNDFTPLSNNESFSYKDNKGIITRYVSSYDNNIYRYDTDMYTYSPGTTIEPARSSYGFGKTPDESISIQRGTSIPIVRDKDGNIIPEGQVKNIINNKDIKGNIVYINDHNLYGKNTILTDEGKIYNYSKESGKLSELYIPGGDNIYGISPNFELKNSYSYEENSRIISVLRGEKGLYASIIIDEEIQVFPISDSGNELITSTWVGNIFTWVNKDGSVRMIDFKQANIVKQIEDGKTPKLISKEVLPAGSVNPDTTVFQTDTLFYTYENGSAMGSYIDKNNRLHSFPIEENSKTKLVADNVSYVDGVQNLFKNRNNNKLFVGNYVNTDIETSNTVSSNEISNLSSYISAYTYLYLDEDGNKKEDKEVLDKTIDDVSKALAEKHFVSNEVKNIAIPLIKNFIISYYNGDEDGVETAQESLMDIFRSSDTYYIDNTKYSSRSSYDGIEEFRKDSEKPENKLDDSSWMIKSIMSNTVLGDTSQRIVTEPIEPSQLKNDGDRTIRTYNVGDIDPGKSAHLYITSTINKDKKEQFLSNLTWAKGDKTPDDTKEPKDPKVPSSVDEFNDNDWGVDTGNDLKANNGYADDNDFYDGVPVYIPGDEDAEETVTIGGKAFKDDNKNGTREDDEKDYLPGVKVKITTTGDNPKTIGETVTDDDGSWSYKVPKGQDYIVIFDADNIKDEDKNYHPTGDNGSTLKTKVITSDDNTYDMGYATSDKGYDATKTRSGSTPKIIPGKSFKDNFTITVTNNLGKDSTLGELVDNPVVPEGMTIESIKWKKKDDKEYSDSSQKDKGYLIGDKDTKIADGETIEFDIVMTVKVSKNFAVKNINSDSDKEANSDNDYGNTVDTPGVTDINPKNNGGEFDVVEDDTTSDDNSKTTTPKTTTPKTTTPKTTTPKTTTPNKDNTSGSKDNTGVSKSNPHTSGNKDKKVNGSSGNNDNNSPKYPDNGKNNSNNGLNTSGNSHAPQSSGTNNNGGFKRIDNGLKSNSANVSDDVTRVDTGGEISNSLFKKIISLFK